MIMKTYNNGLAVLRILSAQAVVSIHFGGWNPIPAVPVFILLAFYFTGERLASGDMWDLMKRLKRILYPFWFWGIVYWVIKTGLTHKFDIGSLIGQLVVGHTVCAPLYFLADLAVLTVFMFFLARCGGRYIRVLNGVVFCLAFVIQYCDFNVKLCSVMTESFAYCEYPVGRLVELLPFAILGWTISARKIDQFLQRNSFLVCVCSFLTIVMSARWGAVLYKPAGYHYQGVILCIDALCYVLLFQGLGNIANRYQFKSSIFHDFSALTMGVYCLHWGVGLAVERLLHLPHGYLLMIVTVFLSFLFAFICSKISFIQKYIL